MLTQPRKRISTLALLEPEISGGRLLEGGFWGINLAAAQLNFPDRGLKIQIPAWSSMSKGDNCKLLLNKMMVDQKFIAEDIEIGERVTVFVPPQRLLTGEWELSYSVKRISQADEPGPVLKLFVKLELPGGQDTNPDYGHSELAMTFDPLDILTTGVGPEHLDKGVHVIVAPKPDRHRPYPFAAVGDVITVAWAGKTVESTPVTQEQIDDPDAHPIRIHVDGKTIELAGDSAGVSVSYKIRDRVYNESEDWCEAVSIAVDTQNLRLGAPILKQADGLIVDLEDLGDELPQVEVWADDVNIFKQNDDIVVLVTGTTLEGKEISATVTQRIQTAPPVRVTVAHSNSALRALAKRTAVYSYQVLRAGVPIENYQSKSRAYSVIGEPTRLAAPIALDNVGGAVDPDLAEYRIRIPYDPLITPENAIELKWFGTRPDLTTYDPELEWYFPSEDEANDPNGFIITVEGKHGKTLEGGTLDLSYNLLTDENGTVTRRPSLHAPLLNVGEPQRELVKPIVFGEQDGALDPADLPGGTGKITAPRPIAVPTQTDDVVTFFWVVEDQQPVSDFKKLNALSKDKDVVFTLNAEFVAQHIEAHRGKTVQVSYKILRAASNTTSQSNVLEFVIGEPVVLDPPTIDSVTGTIGGTEIPSGSSTTETSFKFQGKASAGLTVELRDNTTPVGIITVDANGAWEHTLDEQSIGDHSYTLKGNYGAMPETEAWMIKVAGKENLIPPSIKEAPNNILEPIAARDTLTAVIPAYPNMIGTQVSVTWAGVPGEGSETVGPVAVTTQTNKDIVLPNSLVAFNLGKTVTMSYIVIRGNNEPAPSPPRTVTVSPMPESALEKSWITEAPNNGEGPELEITALVDGASIRTNIWPLGAIGQPVELTLQGKKADGASHDCALLTGDKHAVHQTWLDQRYYTVTAPYSYLKDLAHGSELKVLFKASLDKTNNMDTAIIFPVRAYTISTKKFGLPSFTNAPYTIAPAGRLKDIEILLNTSSNTPVPEGHLNLTLPPDFKYADGGSGQRELITDSAGKVSVSGVKGALNAGSYNLIASSDSQTANATVTVKGPGPVGSIPVGDSPGGIAVSPDGTRLYVCIGREAKVSVIDTATNQILTNIPAGETPRGIVVSPDGTRAYLCIIRENRVLVIDTATNQVLTDINVGTDPSSMAVSPDGTRAYCGNFGNKTISVIDTATNLVLANISVGNNPKGIVVSPDGTRAYVCNYDSHTVSVIDTATNLVLTYIPVELRPYNIAGSPDGTRVYVGGYRQTVTVIDTATHLVLTNISVGSYSGSIAISPDGTRLYSNHHELNKVSVIDTVTNRVLTNIPVGGYPTGVAVSPDGTRIYVTNQISNTISVIDTTTY
ncbi:YncE family protein [Pseudomonas sp. R1-1]|uniref:beta-propeller fold lactonase family protein n=1 Tax=Pseudomonas sp. R1-1 TaxID=1602529 RepID=UPI003DA9356D